MAADRCSNSHTLPIRSTRRSTKVEKLSISNNDLFFSAFNFDSSSSIRASSISGSTISSVSTVRASNRAMTSWNALTLEIAFSVATISEKIRFNSE